MSNLIWLLLLFPVMLFGQISFNQTHLGYDGIQRISPPLELPNGNFVCSAIVSHNHVWVNFIYLFSECGELVATLPISTPAEYMVISDLMVYDTSSFLASGYCSDSTFHNINLVLDNETLEIRQDKRFFGRGLIDIGKSVQVNGRIYQTGITGGYLIVSTVMNTSFQRNLHLYKYYEDLPDASFAGAPFITSLPNRIYSLEWYDHLETNRRYHILRCQDQKLQSLYEIGGHFDTFYNTIKGTIGLSENDTMLIAIEERDLSGQVTHNFIRKYWRDNIIWQYEVEEFSGLSTYSTCKFESGVFECIDADGTVARFDRQGAEIFYNDHLPTVLGGAHMLGAIPTKDGGWFNCSATWVTIEGESRNVLRIIKTTADYDITEKPHPRCIVSTNSPEISPLIELFPNPASNEIIIRSEDEILQYKVLDASNRLLMSGSPKTNEFAVQLNLPAGYYSIVLESNEGLSVQKFLIVY